MATGTEAKDYSEATGNIYSVANAAGMPFTILTRVMKVEDIIAADATLTAAAKITAGQEITAFTLPIGFLVMGTVVYIKTAGTAAGTLNIGTYADTTAFDAAISNATAATWFQTETDAQGIASGGALITSRASDADKVCVEYIADETTGTIVIAVFGLDFSNMLNL